ncbi:hypothetical protein [Clostridium sp. DL1XJH146]
MSTMQINRKLTRIEKRKRKSGFFHKLIITIITIMVVVSYYNYNENQQWEKGAYNSIVSEKMYNSMGNLGDRLLAYNAAVDLNGGSSANTCVYFVSEVLRMNGEYVDNSICNTLELLDVLNEKGWKREYDYSKLKHGDICFTTDINLNDDGKPTHTYIFMGWVEEGNYDYAYICDNQAKDYEGKIYHIRNLANVEEVDGNTKEPFSFFMYRKNTFPIHKK